jgi:phosphatidate cytidylyltransferase
MASSLRQRGAAAGSAASAAAASRDRRESSPGDSETEEEAASLASETEPAKVMLLANEPVQSKLQSFVTRASWSLVMIFSFLFVVVYLQQSGCAVLVFALQTIMYKELVSLQMSESSERELPGFRFLYAYWFMVTSLFTYGNELEPHFLMHSLKHFLGFKLSDHFRRLSLYTFMLYSFGLIMFVWSLRAKHYKYQFKQFAYCHVTLLVVVVQSSVLVSNMFHGLIWFLLPCSLVICNDIWAYIFGFFFGRTPLIELSPKKTWEGFIGGWFSTMVWAFAFVRLLSRFPLMVCERRGFRLEFWPECAPSALFEYLPLRRVIGNRVADLLPALLQDMQLMPMDEHVLWMAIFASIVAPFGGFFASGFKRAFKIKDFGDSIPGHGGITDRMDCQILMGMFVYVYYQARIVKITMGAPDPDVVLRLLMELPVQDKLDIYKRLGSGLLKQGLIKS